MKQKVIKVIQLLTKRIQTWIKELYFLLSKKMFESRVIIFLWHCNNFANCEGLLYTIYDNLFLNNCQHLPQIPGTDDC